MPKHSQNMLEPPYVARWCHGESVAPGFTCTLPSLRWIETTHGGGFERGYRGRSRQCWDVQVPLLKMLKYRNKFGKFGDWCNQLKVEPWQFEGLRSWTVMHSNRIPSMHLLSRLETKIIDVQRELASSLLIGQHALQLAEDAGVGLKANGFPEPPNPWEGLVVLLAWDSELKADSSIQCFLKIQLQTPLQCAIGKAGTNGNDNCDMRSDVFRTFASTWNQPRPEPPWEASFLRAVRKLEPLRRNLQFRRQGTAATASSSPRRPRGNRWSRWKYADSNNLKPILQRISEQFVISCLILW